MNGRQSPLALVMLGFLWVVGCQTVIGTQDRTLDPTLSDADAASPACTKYCQTIMTNCVGANEQYRSLTVCLAACKVMDPGTEGADSGNSVQCRQHWATTGEPETDCPYAGPAGSGQCGSTCDSYCTLVTHTCPGAFETYAQCIGLCQKMPDKNAYYASEQRGNSVQCRIFHASAATQNRNHCAHAGSMPSEYCVASEDNTPVNSCDPPQDAEACDLCEYKHCCAEVNDCYNDTICDTADAELDQCVEEGGGDECQAGFVATNAQAAALQACKSQKCANECGLSATP